jgi:hypothetical protein
MSNPIRPYEPLTSENAALVLVEAAELVDGGKLRKRTVQLLARSLDMSRVMIELPGPWISGVRSCDIEDMKKALVAELGVVVVGF